MKKIDVTILTIADSKDWDSYKKLLKEKDFILKQGFNYKHTSYSSFLKGKLPKITTEKVIIMFFFPFIYWNKHVEHKNYRGVYGNLTFYKKFNTFSKKIIKVVKNRMKDKKIFFINDPLLSSYYRDKKMISRSLTKAKVTIPDGITGKSAKGIEKLLERGQKFFIKPRCGSMGKGITFLQMGDWQTNFNF